jgi:DNA-binding CsgD family transcriptional regulator
MVKDDELYHYGIKFRSGRYPYGSGKDPFQHDGSFAGYVNDLKNNLGWSEKEIAKKLGISIDNLRAKVAIDTYNARKGNINQALELYEQGKSYSQIAREMNMNPSSVRSLLSESVRLKTVALENTARALEKAVKRDKYIDVSKGVELQLGISQDRLDKATQVLYDQGYELYNMRVPQLTTGNYTTMKVLVPPGTTYNEVYKNINQVRLPVEYTENNGQTYREKVKPVEIDKKRVAVRYAEDGGIDKDGVIELRRGVEDLDLGNAHYAQVRIALDNGKYIKGMAVYGDNMPPGKDIIFNTNKHKNTPFDDVFKEQKKDDPNNPFGSSLKTDDELNLIQRHYVGKDGKEHTSALNIVREEGDWGEWKKTLASQFLSKQPKELAKKQLNLSLAEKAEEFEKIKELTNPTIRKKYLIDFAESCDSDAVDLKAAALPKQKSHVILPFPDMPENRIYAPNYKNGEEVILVRYPHGGTFEIPSLIVDNKNKAAKKLLGNASDVVGIHPKAAAQLSGADFDGDSVMVIPRRGNEITAKSPLKGLENFDPKEAYPEVKGMKKMTRTDMEMGKISNLITDMNIKGADEKELARAVRHSMVVIDAKKHSLNYKQSEIDNGIAELKKIYQNGGGTSTLISRAKSTEYVPKRSGYDIDPNTGEKVWREKHETYEVKKKNPDTGEWISTGETKERTVKSTKMAEAKDARELSSGSPIEEVYASYANKLKAMANEARKESIMTDDIKRSPSAAKAYEKEVASIKDKLTVAKKNAPLERQAQVIANAEVKLRVADNPALETDKDAYKKAKNLALANARSMVGAGKQYIKLTDKEWEAIQANAISATMLKEVMQNSDSDHMRELAMPKQKMEISNATKNRIKMMDNSGYTLQEIAEQLEISTTSISNVLTGKT